MTNGAQQPQAKRPERRQGKIHPLSRTTYPGRILIGGMAAAVVLAVIGSENLLIATAVVLWGLAYPHLMFLIARRTRRSREVGYATFFIDALTISVFIMLMQYPALPSLILASVVVTVALLMAGVRTALAVLAFQLLTLALGLLIVEPAFDAHNTGPPLIIAGVTILCLVFYVAWQVNQLGRGLIKARKSLEAKNQRVMAQTAQMENLNKVAQLVNSTLDLDRVMTAIMESLSDIVEFDQESILLVDNDNQALVLKRFAGTGAEQMAENLADMRIPLTEKDSVFVHTLINNRWFASSKISEARPLMSPSDARIYDELPVRSLMNFPLTIDNRVSGVLAFSNTRKAVTFDQDDLATIARHVEFIAIALRNALLFEEVAAAQQAANVANQAKSQFLANMSHELRTPMNAVIGYSEMLLEEAADQGLEDFVSDLTRIQSAGKHLLSLINDVLDLSKIEADKVELFLEPIDIDQFVSELKGTVEPMIEANGNQLLVVQENITQPMKADITKLRQVALNLLSNATKFTKRGTVQLGLRQFEDEGRSWLEIKVTDSGIGMTDAQLEQVFDPFTQADASTTRNYGGTGLGLAITRRFCELMGGSIGAESEPGKGSTFTVLIPAVPVEEPGQRSASISVTSPDGLQSAARVLVIDDDPATRDLIQRLLSSEGLEVKTAESGARGLELAREMMPDVITLDALMPNMDGWSVLCQLKDDPELKTIPVVMVTFVDEQQKGFALGAADYLVKPIDRKLLMSVVNRFKAPENSEALVVDDDENARDMVSGWLERGGWNVHRAVNGREGLEAYRLHLPALIILDLMMPEVDGFEFLATLRREFPESEARIIVVTAKDLTAEDRARLNGSVARIIQKSQVPGKLLVREIARYLPTQPRPG